MHHGLEEAAEIGEITLCLQLVEPLFERAQIFCVVIRFEACDEYFLAEVRERGAVGALILFENAQSNAHPRPLELLEDGVEMVCFVLPEFNFDLGRRI